MGLLDDAIREHLELKRRRGADPTEIERAEREALGPVRRQPEPIQDLSLDEPPDLGHEPFEGTESDYAFPTVAEPSRGHEPASWPEEEDLEPRSPAEAWPDEPAAAEPAERWPHEEPMAEAPPKRWTHEEPATEPATESWRQEEAEPPAPSPHPAQPPVDPSSHLHQATEEYDVGFEHEHEPEPAKEGDDMLEETPEFLQDTPDHDRLWFEQRPPRDFDFDE